MDKTMRAVLVGVGLIVVLFLAWKGIAYGSCVSSCKKSCNSGSGLFSGLQNSLCRLEEKNCLDGCRFF